MHTVYIIRKRVLIAIVFVVTMDSYVKDKEFSVAGFPYDWNSITHLSAGGTANDPNIISKVGI